MIEPEMAFADLNDYMDNVEAMLKYVLKDVMATCPDELNMLNKFVDKGLLERPTMSPTPTLPALPTPKPSRSRSRQSLLATSLITPSAGASTCRPSTSAS